MGFMRLERFFKMLKFPKRQKIEAQLGAIQEILDDWKWDKVISAEAAYKRIKEVLSGKVKIK